MVIEKRLFGKKIANHFDYSSTKKGAKSLATTEFYSTSGGSANMIKKKITIEPSLSLLSDLSVLLYLENHEPFSFALAKIALRKAYSLSQAEFGCLYRGYKQQLRGLVA